MMEKQNSNEQSNKQFMKFIYKSKISEIMPFITPIAERYGLILNRAIDFKKAIKLLETHILHEIWHIGWDNVNMSVYADIKIDKISLKDMRINKNLLMQFLNITNL